ncbi:hypothetical protein GCM10009827_114490 [Dactylosporangium maewongense]|uniref:Uncharacterized protein n=1 Tax=Dactylosporangium maewongense TaxID=634393 RepID=A0ABN2DAM3_9ACTN
MLSLTCTPSSDAGMLETFEILQGTAIAAGSGVVRPEMAEPCNRRGKSVMCGTAAQSRVMT